MWSKVWPARWKEWLVYVRKLVNSSKLLSFEAIWNVLACIFCVFALYCDISLCFRLNFGLIYVSFRSARPPCYIGSPVTLLAFKIRAKINPFKISFPLCLGIDAFNLHPHGKVTGRREGEATWSVFLSLVIISRHFHDSSGRFWWVWQSFYCRL